MGARLKAIGDHAARLLDPLLAINDVRRREDVEQHTGARDLDRAADLKDAINIVVADLTVRVCYRNLAA
jgi:hypothetical protein